MIWSGLSYTLHFLCPISLKPKVDFNWTSSQILGRGSQNESLRVLIIVPSNSAIPMNSRSPIGRKMKSDTLVYFWPVQQTQHRWHHSFLLEWSIRRSRTLVHNVNWNWNDWIWFWVRNEKVAITAKYLRLPPFPAVDLERKASSILRRGFQTVSKLRKPVNGENDKVLKS